LWRDLNSCVFKQQLGLYFIKFSESGIVLFYIIMKLFIGDHKNSKSLISNAHQPGKGLSSNAQPPGRALQENAQGGWARLDLTDA
jgi:hypothetical protein